MSKEEPVKLGDRACNMRLLTRVSQYARSVVSRSADIHRLNNQLTSTLGYTGDNPKRGPAVVCPVVSGRPRVGKNDPCPCGSGKKFKKCCHG